MADSKADAVGMMLGEAVNRALIVMADVRRLKADQFPVLDPGKCVQNILLIRYQQKLVHPMTSEALLELCAMTLYPTCGQYANEISLFKGFLHDLNCLDQLYITGGISKGIHTVIPFGQRYFIIRLYPDLVPVNPKGNKS